MQHRTLFLLVWAFTLLGAMLRFWHSEKRLLWLDEIHTWQVVNEPQSILAMMQRWWNSFIVSDPPLYYVINYLFSGANQEASHLHLRMAGLIMGIACIPLFYLLAKRLVGQTGAAVCALLMAVNPFAIQYSQEYRPYAQLLLATLLYLHAQVLVGENFTWRRFGYLAATCATLIYTHYFGGFALAAGYIIWAGNEVLRRWRRQEGRTPLTAFVILPLALGALYIPVVMYGLGQARHFSSAVDSDGTVAKKLLAMYLASKAHTNYFTDLPKSLLAGYQVPTERWMLVVYGIIAAAGVLRMLLRSPRLLAGVALWLVITTLMAYGFYEAMKYPYEPRRNIFQLPALLLVIAQGILLPTELARLGKSHRLVRAGGAAVSCAVGLGVVLLSLHHFRTYDAWGHRTNTNQADWKAMAGYVTDVVKPGQTVNVPVINGSTWARSQYTFYQNRVNPGVRVTTAGTIPELRALFQSGVTGVWFITTVPWELPTDLFEHLVVHGRWVNVVGGSVVFVPASSLDASQHQPRSQVVVSREPMQAALAARRGSVTADVVLSAPLHAKFSLARSHPYALLNFEQGAQWIHADVKQATHPPTTFTLFRRVVPGEWQRAADFDELEPRSSRLTFPVYEGIPAVALQYNGTLRYRFFLSEAGAFDLDLEARNDKPGPLSTRVFVSGAGELPVYEFNGADNEYSIVSQPVRLQAGLNELTVYYNSFRRVKEPQWFSADETNQFEFFRWRLRPGSERNAND